MVQNTTNNSINRIRYTCQYCLSGKDGRTDGRTDVHSFMSPSLGPSIHVPVRGAVRQSVGRPAPPCNIIILEMKNFADYIYSFFLFLSSLNKLKIISNIQKDIH